jgi:hypothetical protein
MGLNTPIIEMKHPLVYYFGFSDYVRFLQTYPKGTLDGLAVIMQAALCYELNVDEQLRLLTDEITGIESTLPSHNLEFTL